MCEDSTDETGCSSNASGCVFYQNKCITKKGCSSYTLQTDLPGDTEKQAWCEGVTDSSDNKCKWDGSKCAAR